MGETEAGWGFAKHAPGSACHALCIFGDGINGGVSRGVKCSSAVEEHFTMNQSNNINSLGSSLPHHRLHVYRKSLELLAAVRAAQVRDAKLRDEVLRAAKGTCLNIAEAT